MTNGCIVVKLRDVLMKIYVGDFLDWIYWVMINKNNFNKFRI